MVVWNKQGLHPGKSRYIAINNEGKVAAGLRYHDDGASGGCQVASQPPCIPSTAPVAQKELASENY